MYLEWSFWFTWSSSWVTSVILLGGVINSWVCLFFFKTSISNLEWPFHNTTTGWFMVTLLIEIPYIWASSPTWTKVAQNMPVHHDLSKGLNCQVAGKCIDILGVSTSSLHQKSLINSNIVNKRKCIYWFRCKIVIGSQRKTSRW